MPRQHRPAQPGKTGNQAGKAPGSATRNDSHRPPERTTDADVERLETLLRAMRAENARLARLAALPEQNPNPVVEADLEGRVRYANPSALRLFPDLLEKGAAHPWLSDWKEEVRAAGDGHVTSRVVTIGARSCHQVFVRVPGEGAVRVYGFDVTDRVHAERALRESEERLRLAQDNANTGAFDWDVRTGRLYWTPELERVWGLEVGTVRTYDDFRQRVHPGDLARVERDRDTALREHRSFDLEFRIIRRDGDVRWISSRGGAVCDEAGQPVRVLGNNVDITDRKREQAAIAADLEALTRLHALSQYGLEPAGIERMLQETMDAAVAIVHADKGTLQLLEGDSLRIAAQCGHDRPFLEYFAAAENVASVCGEATRRGERVVVPDVETSPLFAGTASLGVLRAAGVRAVQSTPMLTRSGRLLGILTTQWSTPHWPDEHNLWRIDLLARQAADLIEQKAADEGIRASEERFRGIVETAEEGIATHDVDGTITYVNRRMADMLGYSREEIIGRSSFDFIDDEGKEAVSHARQSVREGSFGTERKMRRRDGSTLWTLANISPRRDDSGALLGYLAMHTDITARKQAEEALEAATRRFQTILDHAPLAIYVKDRDGRFVFGNRRLEQYTGRPLEELLGKTDYDFAPKDDADRWRVNDLEVLEGRVAEFEEIGTDRDGRPYVNLSVKFPLTDEGGRVVEMCGISTDITDRKRADEALRESGALLAEAQRIARLGSWKWDIPSGRVTWSPETFRLLGHEPGSFVPTFDRFAALVHAEDRAKVTRAIQDALVGRAHFDLDFRFLRSDESVCWIHSAGEVTFDTEGHATAMTGVVLDITERKQAEETLREADRRKDEFIAILSHELRNPLAPIRYALPVLSEQPLEEAARRAVAVIDRQAAHLTRLVDDLLDVSRIAAGKIELRRDYVTVASVVAAAVEAASPTIAGSRHSLDIAVPDEPLWLHVDGARISQAIGNLLNNSAKYTPHGGRIRLEATSVDSVALIRVLDNGIGLGAEALTTVFEMFRQVSAPNRTQGGLGIGLTLAKQFVEMHGGTIEAHSAGENAGAEFVIRLPLAPSAVPRDERRETRRLGQPVCLRVLVVDDNVDLVDMLAMVVEGAGHNVRKAFDGRSAISAALEYQPHVVLLDVGMPDVSGIEVAAELRRHPGMAGTRIVALTGWGQAEDRRRTALAGFDDHLTKPTDPQKIQHILAEVAERVTASGSARSVTSPSAGSPSPLRAPSG